MTENRDEPIPVEPRPPLHAPKVYTMNMGHIPLTAFVTGAVSFIFAVAFHLGTAPPVAAMVIMVVLFILSALVPTPPTVKTRETEAPADSPAQRQLTAGTRFTIIRVSIVSLMGGLAVLPTATQPDALLWALAAMGLGAALLEATDNWLARITGSVSGYSERLSAMTGAFFALVLALLPMQLGLVGMWIIAAGVLGFAAVAIAPRGQRGELPELHISARLALRLLLLGILVPLVPDWGRTALGVLAVVAALGLVFLALQTRIRAAKTQNRPISDA